MTADRGRGDGACRQRRSNGDDRSGGANGQMRASTSRRSDLRGYVLDQPQDRESPWVTITASLQLLRADGECSEESRLTSKPRRLGDLQDDSRTDPHKAHA